MRPSVARGKKDECLLGNTVGKVTILIRVLKEVDQSFYIFIDTRNKSEVLRLGIAFVLKPFFQVRTARTGPWTA